MNSLSTFEVLGLLNGMSMVNTSVVSKQCSCSGTYVTGTLIRYTVQMIMKACIALGYAIGMQPFSEIVTPYLIFSSNRNISRIL